MGKDDFILPLGSLGKDDLSKVTNEMRRRGWQSTDSGPKKEGENRLREIADSFLIYKDETLRQMGIDAEKVSPFITLGSKLPKDPKGLLRVAWDERANEWAGAESDLMYHTTMLTLLRYLEINPAKNERIISLGSGPGLYETFLGGIIGEVHDPKKVRIIAADFSPRMTQFHKKVLALSRTAAGARIENVSAVTGDMSSLGYRNGYFDQIICNNSLQWVPDTDKALSEMRRIINPEGLGLLYLVVNTNPMKVDMLDGSEPLVVGDFTIPSLFDKLQEQRFSIERIRQAKTAPGYGQFGSQAERIFIKARYSASGKISDWRDRITSADLKLI